MSFSLTTAQVRRREKTVTRRMGWWSLQPGAVVWAVEKAMGLKKGERVVRVCPVRVVSAGPEPLRRLLDEPDYGAAEAKREGFPSLDGPGFFAFFVREMGVALDASPNRIEFEYVDRPDWPAPVGPMRFRDLAGGTAFRHNGLTWERARTTRLTQTGREVCPNASIDGGPDAGYPATFAPDLVVDVVRYGPADG